MLSAAEYVISKLGGLTSVSKGLSTPERRVPPTTVQGWKDRKKIPQDWWLPLIDLAKENGVEITVDDFLREHPENEAA
jgi:hypothetical protein